MEEIRTGASFLSRGWNTRGSGMAETGGTDAWLNPGALPKEEKPSLTVSGESRFGKERLFEVVQDTTLTYLQPHILKGTLKADLKYTRVGDIEKRDKNDQPLGTFSAHFGAPQVSYGRQEIPAFSWGVGIKGVYGQIAEKKVLNTLALDVGGFVQFPLVEQIDGKFEGGLSIQNLGGSRLPLQLTLGLAYSLTPQEGDRIKLAIDGKWREYDKLGKISVGLEYNYQNTLVIRGGYQAKEINGSTPGSIAMGFGVNIGNFSLDYAFVPQNLLGDSQKASLSYRFK